ncbi:sodium:calcium antiporter [Bacteriovoracaceae bacterium]|nr:sodium:calcium antiporter [Bacteriovoracaceae bacterium]
MIAFYILLFIISLVLLYYGAEFSLDSSEKIGKKIGLPPIVVGMLLVGFGTSLPELFVSHLAIFRGASSVAFGTLIGSNVANGFLVLGICSFFQTLRLNPKDHALYSTLHLLMTIALLILFQRQVFDIYATLILLSIFFVNLYYIISNLRKDKHVGEENKNIVLTWKDSMYLGFGLAFLYGGGELLIYSGVRVCETFNISTYVISAIFVAFGTSFPELVTTLMSVFKKKDTDIIIGNIIGSNLFNCSFILGSIGYKSLPITSSYSYEIYALLSFSGLLLFLSMTRKSLNKITGVVFLGTYLFLVLYWTKVITFS